MFPIIKSVVRLRHSDNEFLVARFYSVCLAACNIGDVSLPSEIIEEYYIKQLKSSSENSATSSFRPSCYLAENFISCYHPVVSKWITREISSECGVLLCFGIAD